MKLSTQIKPISYIKSHAAEVLDQLHEEREPIIITQNGEARAVLMDVRSYEQSQETLAMLRIVAIGEQQIREGKVVPLSEAAADLRAKLTAKQD